MWSPYTAGFCLIATLVLNIAFRLDAKHYIAVAVQLIWFVSTIRNQVSGGEHLRRVHTPDDAASARVVLRERE